MFEFPIEAFIATTLKQTVTDLMLLATAWLIVINNLQSDSDSDYHSVLCRS